MADRAYLERLTKELVDKGRLIEAGWIGYRLQVMNPNAGAVQLKETRMAFFAGAQHLFGSINAMLDKTGDDEPTDQDLKRMDLIDTELNEFIELLKKELPTQGSA